MRPRGEHFKSLDGLRGVACLGVAIHHCSGCIFTDGGSLADAPHVFFYGFSGVEIFFALSGFLLALPILRRREEEPQWGVFAKKRILRIVPPAWSAMLLFIGLGVFLGRSGWEPLASAHPVVLPTSAGQALAMFLFWGRIYLNSSYWTLPVEVRWYLALPLLIWIVRKYGIGRLLLFSLGVACMYAVIRRRIGTVAQVAIGPLPLYLPLFACAILLADLSSRQLLLAGGRPRTIPIRIGLSASLALVVAFTHSNMVTLSRVVPASAFGFFMLWAALEDPLIQRILSWGFLAWIGRISFSIYLTHEVVINCCVAVARNLGMGPIMQGFVYFILVPAVFILFAFGFHLLFERPWMRKRMESGEAASGAGPRAVT